VAVRIALPKGKLLDETAAFLEKAGWRLNDYSQTMRNYRLKSARFPEMLIKVFQEKRHSDSGGYRQLRFGHMRAGVDRRTDF